MKLSAILILISCITAQIELIRPDDTIAIISAIPGCYCIQPPIQIIANSGRLSFEFYDNWSCSGDKIDEAEGDVEFFKPLQAYSIKVIESEDEDKSINYMLYREVKSAEKCKNSIEIGKFDESIDLDKEYKDDDLDNSRYEPYKNYLLATSPNSNFGKWNMDSYKISKNVSKKEVQVLYNGNDDDESWEFGDDEFDNEEYPEIA